MTRKSNKAAADLFRVLPQQDLCGVCRAFAHFSFNDPQKNGRTHYCRHHVPDFFNLPRTLVREIEDEYLKNHSAGGASTPRPENAVPQ